LIRLPVNTGARDKHSRRNNNFYLYCLNLHNKNKLIPTKTCTSSKRVEIQNRGEKEMAQTKLGGGRKRKAGSRENRMDLGRREIYAPPLPVPSPSSNLLANTW